ncbi:MAG: regulatory protein RecX [Cardiobacteriaceae bacterium]|nr:regulatory protein RecX [Cardiobacteriaceae bacterium]
MKHPNNCVTDNSEEIQKFRDKCIRALARREHSQAELLQKARDFALSDEVAREIVENLSERGWQSDERFTENFLRAKTKNGDGAAKIRLALQKRKIANELIEEQLREVDWNEILTDIYRRKYGERPIKTPQEKAKRIRFLLSRGFSYEEIRKVCK